MKYVDEFRDPELITRALDEIRRLAVPSRQYRIMEVCGGHTHAIHRFGLKDVLPENIELIHGPGCPVCVLPMGRIDDGLSIAEQPEVIFAAFGDMMRVPGTKGSPLDHQARGMDVRIVYSPLDALKLARANPDRHVMFFAIGFETTAPSTALTLMRAKAEGIRNFSVFCNHVTIIPAIRAILDSPDMRIDAFVGPGHVSTVIGCRPYEWIARDEGKPIAVSGFEPLDILQGIVMLLRQLGGRARGRREPVQACRAVGGQSRGVARDGGGVRAASLLRVARPRVHFTVGAAPSRAPMPTGTPSGASPFRRFASPIRRRHSAGKCSRACSSRPQCKLFGCECTPEHPVGALMVSSEGSCAAYFNYEHRKVAAAERVAAL